MDFSPEDVRRIADLARLHLEDQEVAKLQDDLTTITAYVQQLQEVDTTGVEPIANVAGLANVLRPDVPGGMLDRHAALINAPHHDGEGFLVPRVVER